jgi:hypothetical protein
MLKHLQFAVVAIGLSGAVLAPFASAQAGGLGISLNLGNVAFGYQDGYWDRGHHWHHWRNDGEMRQYRAAHGSQYNDYRHDRDPDMGWHH